jgi:hypothetical protein
MYYYFVAYFYTKENEDGKLTFGFGNSEAISETPVEHMEDIRELQKTIGEDLKCDLTIQGITLLRYEDAIQ